MTTKEILRKRAEYLKKHKGRDARFLKSWHRGWIVGGKRT